LVLQREILRLKAANLLSSDPFRGLYLSDEQVEATLREWTIQPSDDQREYTMPGLAELSESIDAVQLQINRRLKASLESDYVPPMARLISLFELSQFECKVLIASVAVELDLRFETLYSWARNDVTKRRPSIDLVLKLVCNDGDEQLRGLELVAEHRSLVQNQLIRIGDDTHEHDCSFLARSLRADQRIVRFLCDRDEIESCLLPFTCLSHPSRMIDDLCLPKGLRNELW